MTVTTNLFRKRTIQFSPKAIYAKLLFINTVVYILFFSLGCLLFHSFDAADMHFSGSFSEYFDIGFDDCNNVFDFSNSLLELSKNEISHLIIIFTAGFTMLSGIIIYAVLAFRGFSLGFIISYISYLIHNQILDISNPTLKVGVFAVLCTLSTVVMIHLGVKTACFCDEFKSLCGRPKKIISSKALYMQIFRLFISLGAILLLNSIRYVV